ncbi:MAG: gliding motility-associated ABC transporter substrate-binding protein GldG [Bacteroidetes bacterium HGW-Bacteroidetes-4]|jgi:gliding-associated putative ABC transporter substrate-binding component GldG|nr:MAG: gliding motility-associated ABC transporter substrate-binding protein GldG [Bacteroidetes bacterium HGW-Bacteroidetes-4]
MQLSTYKKESYFQLIIAVAFILLVWFIAQFVFTRIDLTADKRFTLSEHTKQELKSIDDIIYFRIYLDGEMPAGFKRLQHAMREILDEFRVYGKDNIQYEFIDPSENSDPKARNELFKYLYEKGLQPTNLQVKEKDGSNSQKIIFPGMLMSYQGKEVAVNVLKNYAGYSPEGNLNSSIQALEYELAYAMHKLTTESAPKVAFIDDYGMLSLTEVEDIGTTLSDFYEVYRMRINEYPYSLIDSLGNNNFKLIVIAKPQKAFSEKNKFLIDQFIMNGGSVLWLIDQVDVNTDSLAYTRSTLALNRELNLDDMLFTYGIRINYNLIQDLQCATIPVNTALAGQQPQFAPAPWVYYPLMNPVSAHPISKNLDVVKSEFANAIDTVGNDGNIKKEILLTSSKYSRQVSVPALIDLSMISERQDPDRFTSSFLPTGVLLEGTFQSVFANRVLPFDASVYGNKPITLSQATKMIVISDGDIIRNYSQRNGNKQEALPLGFDRFTRQTFANKEFILNCINYLCDLEGLMDARSKEYKLRMLDKLKITRERLFWQSINLLLPVLLIVLLGIAYNYYRKRKYAQGV